MAEISALVLSAAESLITDNLASMFAVWITRPAEFSVNVTTNFLALMLVAAFDLIAWPLALERLNLVDLSGVHEPLFLNSWVIHLVAGVVSFLFSTPTLLIFFHLAWRALTCVAFLFTLVDSARQVSPAKIVTCGDRVGAGFALAAIQERFYSLVARGTILDALRVVGAGTTLALVANSLASVVTTIQKLSTNLVARMLLLSTYGFNRVFTTEASYDFLLLAWRT